MYNSPGMVIMDSTGQSRGGTDPNARSVRCYKWAIKKGATTCVYAYPMCKYGSTGRVCVLSLGNKRGAVLVVGCQALQHRLRGVGDSGSGCNNRLRAHSPACDGVVYNTSRMNTLIVSLNFEGNDYQLYLPRSPSLSLSLSLVRSFLDQQQTSQSACFGEAVRLSLIFLSDCLSLAVKGLSCLFD